MHKSLCITCVLLGFFCLLQAQTSTTINSTGNYIVPPGVYSIKVQAWGAGGLWLDNSNGSGGGAFVQSTAIPVTPGQSILVTIGNGFFPNTYFGDYFTAMGGQGQNGGNTSSGTYVQTSFKGGNGGAGATFFAANYGGGGGGAGGTNGPGQNGQNATTGNPGNGGPGALGGGTGGKGGLASAGVISNPGQSGTAPGGGKGGIGANPPGMGSVIVTNVCEPASNPKVLGNNVIIADGDGSPSLADFTDFGEVVYFGSNLSRVFTIQNTGSMPLGIRSITATGDDAALFAVQGGNLPRSVAAGTSTTFSVNFTPQSEGGKKAEISIIMDNCNVLIYNFSIRGTGTCLRSGNALVKFKETTIADGDNTPAFGDSTDFGNVASNGFPSIRTYRIHNTGTQAARINGISLTGAELAQFSLPAMSFPLYVAAGASLNIPVTFTPVSAGVKNAVVNIVMDNCATVISIFNYDFAIKGTGFCNTGGTIGTSHSVPFPPQLVPDFIGSNGGTAPTAHNGIPYFWQQSIDSTNWGPSKTPNTTLAYRIDRDSIRVKTYYRRRTYNCDGITFSNVVAINVINPVNGAISGTVRSKNGAPVKGVKVYAQKVSALPGSPVTWIDSTVTVDDGTYSIQRIYYGDPNEVGNLNFVSTAFVIRPFKLNHGFIQPSLTRSLTSSVPQISNVDFTDTTVYAISGKIYQECVGCLNGSNVAAIIRAPLDSVEMYKDNSFITKSGFIHPPGEYGRYSVTVTDPATYKIEPRFKNHMFSPADTNVLVENNKDNVDFKDVTTYTISGKLTAGCNDYIGTATLEFTDILPNDKDGNPRASMFRKRVTTNPGSGTYTITLPARKWQVKVLLFSPVGGGDAVDPTDLLNFFEVKVPRDSLIRDIDTSNATLNLVYNRRPTLDIVGLDPVCALPEPFAIIEQSKEKTFTVKAYQGSAAKNCPATDTTLIINTNIQEDDINEVIELKTENGQAQVKLTGGTPNIVAPHFKVLNLVYADEYGFSTQLNRNVVVTGIKSNIGSFATVSPEVPLMILHDPPGDNSFSFWETTKSNEIATRFYAASGAEASAWAELKLGVKYEAGVVVSSEFAAWGTVKGSVGIGSRINNANEAIMNITTTQNFSTASNDAVVGSQGDVFIGAALNLLYALANEVSFNDTTCSLSLEQKLMIAQNGFATQYIYSEDHIKNTLLPTLRSFVANPLNTPLETNNYNNQIKVWEQTLANNDANKKRAAFDQNISFDGSAGPITSTTTTTSSKSNTIEFDLFIDRAIAIEVGLEVGGSGGGAGVDVAFKMETGNSFNNTVMNSTTIGYTLDDDDNGDFYSVNIKKDPVYNTPVFEMVAGTTSCPYEPGSQPRDEMQLIVPQPVKTDVDPNGEAEFTLKLSNTSQSGEPRTYNLSFIQASNPNGAVVTIGGSQALIPISYTLDYLGEVNILVKVKRGASNIFSYEGLQFRVTDACDGSIEKTAMISAFFTSTCSPIILTEPAPGWITNQADNNVLPLLFKGYTLANTTSVTLEYQRSGANNWITGFTRQASELNNSVNGTLVNWNVTGLTDGVYNLRMKLNCPAGVVNSIRSTGIIDRISPIALGKPEPTDDEFVTGDQISILYNENLDCSGVTPSDVQVRRLSNNALINANVGCFQNKIVVVPLTDISTLMGDSIRVSVANISDINGNGKTTTDSWRFIVGTSIPATGPKALTLSSTTPPGGGAPPGKSILSGPSVMEDAGLPIKFVFELPSDAPNDMLINYSISGNAVFQTDYNIDYSQTQNLATIFNGASGSLTLKKGTKKIELSIKPIPNQQFEPNKTITITLAEGGDYGLGANVTATGTILNDDTPKIYTFTGTGNYNVPANWDNNIVPPLQVLIGDEVIIDPPIDGECILNVPVTVLPGAKFTVMPGKVLRIGSNLQVKKKL